MSCLKLGIKRLKFFVCAGLICVVICLSGRPATGKSTLDLSQGKPDDVTQLQLGADLDRKIAAGQTHNYRITLAANQFINLIVDQRAFSLSVMFFGPDNVKLRGEYQSQSWASHLIAFVTETSGEYRLEIKAANTPPSSKSSYRIRFTELKLAGEAEQRRAQANQLWLEGHDIIRKKSAAAPSLPPAALKYEESLRLFQAAGDRYGEALVLTDLGYTSFSMDQREKAVEYSNRALSQWQSLGEVQQQAALLWGWAPLLNQSDQREKSVDYYKKALALARALNDRQMEIWILNDTPAENRGDPFGRLLDVVAVAREASLPEEEATALNNIAVIYFSLGEPEEAINYLSQARELFHQIGETFWEGQTFNNAGVAYALIGDYRKAIEYFDRAVPLFHANTKPNPEAGTMNATAEAFESLGEPDKAIELYGRVAQLNKTSTIPIINPYARSRVGLARVMAERGEAEKAIALLDEALQLAPKYPPHLFSQSLNLFLRIGAVFDKLGRTDRALASFNQSLEMARSTRSNSGEASALYEIARVQSKSEDLPGARANAAAAIDLIESQRERISDPQLRASYLSTVRERYDLLTDVLMRLHHDQPKAGFDALALENTERARARVLLEMLREARAEIRQGTDKALLDRETRLRQQLNAKAQQQTDLLVNKASAQKLAAVDQEIRELKLEQVGLEAEIRAKNPRYASLTRPHSLTLAEMRQRVLEPDTSLIEYQLGNNRSFVWVMTKDSLVSFELPKRAVIETAARRVYELMTARGRHPKGETVQQRKVRIETADSEYAGAASALTGMILPSGVEQLARGRWLIVADGALQYIPFAALPAKPGGDPLVKTHEVVMLPSASVLAALRDETRGRPPAADAVVTLADPVFDKDDPRVNETENGKRLRSATRGTANTSPVKKELDLVRTLRDFSESDAAGALSRLPFTREEAAAIQSVAPRGSLKLTDFKASRAMALDPQVSNYRIIHLATHALLNTQRPELSGVVFSTVNEQGRPQDGFVRLNEIYNLNLPADLVVLSACQTALGREVNGEGLIGLTRGFMYAGSRRVMASLWNVNDSATADMMKVFYREVFTKHQSPAAALRQSQLEMLKQKQPPYYWAAFELQGEYK